MRTTHRQMPVAALRLRAREVLGNLAALSHPMALFTVYKRTLMRTKFLEKTMSVAALCLRAREVLGNLAALSHPMALIAVYKRTLKRTKFLEKTMLRIV